MRTSIVRHRRPARQCDRGGSSLAADESGLIATKAIVLLTPEEMDEAGKRRSISGAPARSAGLSAFAAPALHAMGGFPKRRSSTG